jgi:hypothetical protein
MGGFSADYYEENKRHTELSITHNSPKRFLKYRCIWTVGTFEKSSGAQRDSKAGENLRCFSPQAFEN